MHLAWSWGCSTGCSEDRGWMCMMEPAVTASWAGSCRSPLREVLLPGDSLRVSELWNCTSAPARCPRGLGEGRRRSVAVWFTGYTRERILAYLQNWEACIWLLYRWLYRWAWGTSHTRSNLQGRGTNFGSSPKRSCWRDLGRTYLLGSPLTAFGGWMRIKGKWGVRM